MGFWAPYAHLEDGAKTLCVAIVFAHALSAASGKFSSKNCRKNVSMIAWACDLLIQFIQTC